MAKYHFSGIEESKIYSSGNWGISRNENENLNLLFFFQKVCLLPIFNSSSFISSINYFLQLNLLKGTGLYEGLEEKLFFSLFTLHAHRKKVNFQFGKTFFMQANPVFIMQTFCVCAESKQILFLLYNWNLFLWEVLFDFENLLQMIKQLIFL